MKSLLNVRGPANFQLFSVLCVSDELDFSNQLFKLKFNFLYVFDVLVAISLI